MLFVLALGLATVGATAQATPPDPLKADISPAQRITTGERPDWSPDGQCLAFVKQQQGY